MVEPALVHSTCTVALDSKKKGQRQTLPLFFDPSINNLLIAMIEFFRSLTVNRAEIRAVAISF